MHNVITKDGYILQLHRIPHGVKENKSKGSPVLLLHGLVESSAVWVISGTNNGLGKKTIFHKF